MKRSILKQTTELMNKVHLTVSFSVCLRNSLANSCLLKHYERIKTTSATCPIRARECLLGKEQKIQAIEKCMWQKDQSMIPDRLQFSLRALQYNQFYIDPDSSFLKLLLLISLSKQGFSDQFCPHYASAMSEDES